MHAFFNDDILCHNCSVISKINWYHTYAFKKILFYRSNSRITYVSSTIVKKITCFRNIQKEKGSTKIWKSRSIVRKRLDTRKEVLLSQPDQALFAEMCHQIMLWGPAGDQTRKANGWQSGPTSLDRKVTYTVVLSSSSPQVNKSGTTLGLSTRLHGEMYERLRKTFDIGVTWRELAQLG